MSETPSERRRRRFKERWAAHIDFDKFFTMTEEDIERTSPPELKNLPADIWDSAVLTEPLFKQQISIRVDLGVLDWFKDQGPRYQTRMNEVLRAYVYRMRRLEGEEDSAVFRAEALARAEAKAAAAKAAAKAAAPKPAKPTKKARATPYDTAAPKGTRKPSRRAPRGG